jgi:CxxC motif-containing protein (DUF1111 family)
MNRLAARVGVVAVLASAAAALAWADEDNDPLGEQTGGATTVYASGRNAFSFAAANANDAERTRFAIGNSFFRRNWVEAPSSTAARDGLGPHFIARSCGGCHDQGGRGAPPDVRNGLSPAPGRPKLGERPLGGQARSAVGADMVEQPVALLMRLSVPGTPDAKSGVVPEPTYGDQFHNAAVQGVKAEGRVTMRWRPLPVRFADGTRITLQKPIYGFADLAYGPMAKGVMASPRIASQLIGVGLLEAIPESEILRNAADQAAAAGPIKGQANRVWDVFAQTTMLGRFGWKANVATLAQQTAAAFVGDIGITSSRFPNESCTPVQHDCLAAAHGGAPGQPEIDDKILADVIFNQALLAPPARRNAGDAAVRRGQDLFMQAQCAACHRPSYVTGEGPLPAFTSSALSGQRIWPHTDLLLHDMGEALADGRPDFLANGRQWRTPPLWGIGLIRDVNNHDRLLHDGRARGVQEAILWHGGEAEDSKQQVLKMNRADRDALVKFVESL